MSVDTLLRKVESLGIFSGEGDLINTPRSVIEATTNIYGPQVDEMIEGETTEFLEGFMAGLFFFKTMDLGARLNALTGEVTEEASQEILEAQVDTVLTLLAEYLQEQRNRD
jgi:hypothetical protein